MRIACIYTVDTIIKNGKPLLSWTEVPFGLSVIGSVLEHSGHTVEIFIYSKNTPAKEITHDIFECYQADLVACTAVTTQYNAVVRIAEIIKQYSARTLVILGGAFATLAPDEAIASACIDAVCVGEGDHSVVEFIKQLEENPLPKGVAHFWIRQPDGSIERNPTNPFITDLDSIPFINRHHWEKYITFHHTSSAILVGRGCPYVCTYCSNHALKEVSDGKFVRFRSVFNIIAELNAICESAPEMKSVYLEVETVQGVPRYARELCVALKEFNVARVRPIEFCINITLTSKFVNNEERCRDLLRAMKEANFTSINFALESGSERMRSEVLIRPKYTNEEIVRFAGYVREFGIGINLFVMVGLPLETYTDFLETREIARLCQPSQIYLGIFYPYPGTKLYDIAIAEGLFDPNTIDTKAERTRPCLKIPGFPKYRIYLAYVLFHFHVYRQHWPMVKLIAKTIEYALKPFPEITIFVRRALFGNVMTNIGKRILPDVYDRRQRRQDLENRASHLTKV